MVSILYVRVPDHVMKRARAEAWKRKLPLSKYVVDVLDRWTRAGIPARRKAVRK